MLMSSNSLRNQSSGLSRFGPNHENSIGANGLDKPGRSNSISEESFKCGAGCLYLPGFSKRKSMVQLSRERNAQEENESTVASAKNEVTGPRESIFSSSEIEASRALSFERFDCRSSASGIVYNLEPEEAGWRSPYYDLPVELIKTVNNESETPINAAFLFDYNPKKSSKNRRKLILAQSKSIQIINTSPEIAWSPSSCPASPSSGL